MVKPVIILIAFLFSTATTGQDLGKEMQCRNGGALVMGAWHQLSFCLHYHKLNIGKVSEVRQLVSKTYPQIVQEIDSESELSLSMKQIAYALPFDFSNNQNANLLESICESSISAMNTYVEPNWQKELSCWQ
ncbi:hypothetical protein [Vogesella sp. LIG4]|uniref:hypothetical protein n=1 Tax=Vogesella sp. LIG4 TaxID=1192162 RepID=UPI0012FDC51E|nr:hypothetical protein [Vogesella sp. LIG4]